MAEETEVKHDAIIHANDAASYWGIADPFNSWLVDRSRIQLGRTGCRRARYREYHSGPTGYGIRHRAQSLPMARGIYIHKIVEGLMNAVLPTGSLPDDTLARKIIHGSVEIYRARCSARGFLDMPDADEGTRVETQRVIAEQSALIEALGWGLYLAWLPKLLEEWEVIAVEPEILLPLNPSLTEPASIIQMIRPDLILRRKVDGSLAQVDVKTTGWRENPSWRRQWEDSAQLMLTKLGIEYALDQPVSFAYILALDTGKRSQEESSGLFKQWSFFLYAYNRSANPPMVKEDWQLRWKYVGEDGKNHTLGKGYQRRETFTFPFAEKPDGWSSIEYWMRSLPVEEILSQHEMIGPFSFLEHSEKSIVTGVVAEETEIQQRLWQLHEVGEVCAWNESDPRFVEALDQLFPQSWNCHPFGKDCQFLSICRREPGWNAPHEDERFELRRPHHTPEVQQALTRGIELPAEQDEDEGGLE